METPFVVERNVSLSLKNKASNVVLESNGTAMRIALLFSLENALLQRPKELANKRDVVPSTERDLKLKYSDASLLVKLDVQQELSLVVSSNQPIPDGQMQNARERDVATSSSAETSLNVFVVLGVGRKPVKLSIS